MKLRFDKRSYNVNPRYKIGVLAFLETSRYKDYRKLVSLIFTFLNTQYGVSFHFGKRKYEEAKFTKGDFVVCVSSEESVQLTEDLIYEVEAVEYKASLYYDDLMECRLKLKNMLGNPLYEQSRFRLAKLTDYTGGPVS